MAPIESFPPETPDELQLRASRNIENQVRNLITPDPDFEDYGMYRVREELNKLSPGTVSMLFACISRGIAETAQATEPEHDANEALKRTGLAIDEISAKLTSYPRH